MTLTEQLLEALRSPNLQAFLRVIRAGESSQELKAYFTVVGGEVVESLEAHPKRRVWLPGLKLWSTAAGAYQFLLGTWAECVEALKLPDFSAPSQDLAAAFLIRRRGALADVLAGRVEAAIKKCAKEWASLPGSPYGQPTRSLKQALATYSAYGGAFAEAPVLATTEPPPMLPAALLTAFLPSLLEAAPKLLDIFKSDGEIAQRNVKAAQVAFDIAKDALQATNEQEVLEKLKTDPEAPAIVQKAIEDRWFELTEAGGGGIEGARKADLAMASSLNGMIQSPSFWIALLMLPLVYMIVGAVVGLWGVGFSDDVRAAIANGVVGMIIGGLIGYYYGQTTSRNRTDKS